ncbi:predicted protein [Plenodomus lingam JN3]|uniref:Predicted protein n=1 Tax=Leptosphaeria maculans (strain JN3 / isolate v23.1.3 / race Av1-4-5-6-7-8) TaxID=985895 RepID=E5A154_LEPMJ|nr:predicted protein [Plenodomus lingam JN3]CBX97510.1 predicted protein [Plenodomus lingam JN3]
MPAVDTLEALCELFEAAMDFGQEEVVHPRVLTWN